MRGLYAAIALLLVGWELQEQGGLISSSSCDLRSTPQVESPLMNPAYKFILRHSTPAVSDRVSVVAIESTLQNLQSNVCPARAFTADLIRAAVAEGAAVIAIDRFYGATACPEGDAGTKALKAAVAETKVPVVVGESTHAPEDAASATCLVVSPQLDLGTKTNRGLTRLNQEVLKLPLRWPVLPSDTAASTAVQQEDSFSLMAATQANAGMRKDADFSKLYNGTEQPYANLAGTLEHQTSSNLICAMEPDKAKAYGIDCSNGWRKKDLRGKVVVIGAESDQDYPSVLGEGMYGFELQARYTAALLSGSYLQQISPLFLLLPLGLYYALSELLIPYLHIHRHPPRPLFHIQRPLAWTVGVFFATMAVGFAVPLLFQRFPPLGMLLGISGILIPRLLIEGWAVLNERTEDPEGDELA
jgi:CHASE2 domain-containing sensor protein